MKKFSTMSGLDINEPPINEVVTKEIDIKDRMMELIDNSLRIIAYGSARKSILMETRIVGKEMLVESLLNLLKDENIKEQLKALESLKENVNDWQSIDNEIAKISENNVYSFLVDSDNEVRSLSSMLENMTDDEIDLKLDLSVNKLKEESNDIDRRITLISNMIDSDNYNHISEKLELFRKKLVYVSNGNSE